MLTAASFDDAHSANAAIFVFDWPELHAFFGASTDNITRVKIGDKMSLVIHISWIGFSLRD